MKQIKKDVVLLVLAFLLVVSIPVGATLAIMHNRTNEVVNTFAPAYVDCTINEDFDQEKKTSVKITNTSNVQAYLRIRVLSYWQDSKGNIVDRPAALPSISYDTTNWIYDQKQATYYCVVPIARDADTPELLKSGSVIMLENSVSEDIKVDGVYLYTNTYYHVVEFVAEAIQSEPDTAVEANWNLTIDDNTNRITHVS